MLNDRVEKANSHEEADQLADDFAEVSLFHD